MKTLLTTPLLVFLWGCVAAHPTVQPAIIPMNWPHHKLAAIVNVFNRPT